MWLSPKFSGTRGVAQEFEARGPDYQAPPCPHYGDCGGCALQHVRAAYYAAWKKEHALAPLSRAGLVLPDHVAFKFCAANSRRRAKFSVEKRGGDIRLGFRQRALSSVADIQSCGVLAPALEAALPDLRKFASLIPSAKFELAITLCENGLDADITAIGLEDALIGPALADISAAMAPANIVRLSVNGESVLQHAAPLLKGGQLALAPASFLQASEAGEAALVREVVRAAKGAKSVADLFCGHGTFAHPVAQLGAQVDGFDSNVPAISALDQLSRHMGAKGKLRAHTRNLFVRPLIGDELAAFDFVIIDPPRAGASAQMEWLAGSRVPRIASVSCNPLSFARDAAQLVAGGYALGQLTIVDQFVYAPHIELVGIFTREV